MISVAVDDSADRLFTLDDKSVGKLDSIAAERIYHSGNRCYAVAFLEPEPRTAVESAFAFSEAGKSRECGQKIGDLLEIYSESTTLVR